MNIRLPHPWDSPGKNTGVGSHPLLQGIFPTEGLNPGLLHRRPTLYLLSSLPGESMRFLAWWSNALRQKAEWWLPGAEEKAGGGGDCLMGTEFSFCTLNRILEMDGNDGCTAGWMFLIPLNCTLELVTVTNTMNTHDYIIKTEVIQARAAIPNRKSPAWVFCTD